MPETPDWNRERLAALSNELDGAYAAIAALNAAVVALTKLLAGPLPDLPEKLSAELIERHAPDMRTSRERLGSRNAAATERLARKVAAVGRPPTP